MGLADLPSVPLGDGVVVRENPLASVFRPAPEPVAQTPVDLALATLSDYVGHVDWTNLWWELGFGMGDYELGRWANIGPAFFGYVPVVAQPPSWHPALRVLPVCAEAGRPGDLRPGSASASMVTR
jgi:hypothetical protein